MDVSFSDAERVKYELTKHGLPDYDVDYAESVTFRLLVPEEKTDHLITRLTELTAGKANIIRAGTEMHA